jgi:hypothetical protein
VAGAYRDESGAREWGGRVGWGAVVDASGAAGSGRRKTTRCGWRHAQRRKVGGGARCGCARREVVQ